MMSIGVNYILFVGHVVAQFWESLCYIMVKLLSRGRDTIWKRKLDKCVRTNTNHKKPSGYSQGIKLELTKPLQRIEIFMISEYATVSNSWVFHQLICHMHTIKKIPIHIYLTIYSRKSNWTMYFVVAVLCVCVNLV